MIRGVKPTALACLILLATVACGVLDPRLPPKPPPPNLQPGLVILEVPLDEVEDLAQDTVRQLRETRLPFLSQTDPDRVRRILAGQVTVGMTQEQVIWVFLSHPTRVRDLGPPGGTTLMWEPSRYFVRFGAAGQAIEAGQY
jgi:hypothetical protein